MEYKTNTELLTVINRELDVDDQITDVDLSRYLSTDPGKKRESRNPRVRDRMNKVMGEESPWYPIRESLKIARQKIHILEKENADLRHNMTFNYSRCTWGRLYPWLLISIAVFFGLVFCVRPWINYKAMEASAGLILDIEKYAARAAEAETEAELMREVMLEMGKDYDLIREKLGEEVE
jgi:hypothetical protein